MAGVVGGGVGVVEDVAGVRSGVAGVVEGAAGVTGGDGLTTAGGVRSSVAGLGGCSPRSGDITSSGTTTPASASRSRALRARHHLREMDNATAMTSMAPRKAPPALSVRTITVRYEIRKHYIKFIYNIYHLHILLYSRYIRHH